MMTLFLIFIGCTLLEYCLRLNEDLAPGQASYNNPVFVTQMAFLVFKFSFIVSYMLTDFSFFT